MSNLQNNESIEKKTNKQLIDATLESVVKQFQEIDSILKRPTFTKSRRRLEDLAQKQSASIARLIRLRRLNKQYDPDDDGNCEKHHGCKLCDLIQQVESDPDYQEEKARDRFIDFYLTNYFIT